jgi:transcriptional regulator with XRE-family HTH domain
MWTTCGVPVDEEVLGSFYLQVGASIQKARKRRGLNQADLAHAVQLTRSSIANIEAGRQRALVHTVVLIARVLDVEISELLPPIGTPDALDSAQHAAVDLDGQSVAAYDFVTATLRRAAGR